MFVVRNQNNFLTFEDLKELKAGFDSNARVCNKYGKQCVAI